MLDRVTRQLRSVQSRSRRLLLTQRLAQWAAGVLIAALALALLDYALRLPGPVRLILAAATVAIAGAWLFARLRRAVAFRPTLEALALRAERLYPDLAGRLASAVSFATTADAPDAEPQNSPESHALARSTVRRAADAAEPHDLTRLINPAATRRALAWCAAATVAWALIAALNPAWASTAAQRWAMPLGGTAWPKRVAVAFDPLPAVWPTDAALPITAQITRGQRDDRRVVLTHQLPDAPPRSVVMEPLGDGRYRFVLDAQPAPQHDATDPRTLTLTLAAGDDTTDPATVQLVEPPRVTRVAATITPPAYAADVLDPQTLTPPPTAGLTHAALAGSTIDLTLTYNKPVTPHTAPERSEDAGIASSTQHASTHPLTQPLDLTPAAIDAFNLPLRDPPAIRLTPTPDAPPQIALAPLAATSVLPTAVVPLQATASDDVALASAQLEAYALQPDDPTDAPPGDDPRVTDALIAPPALDRVPLHTLAHPLDLTTLDAQPGQRLLVVARATDVYRDHDTGSTHDPAVATRVLYIVTEAELRDDLNRALSALREQLEPTAQRQRDAAAALDATEPDTQPADAATAQADVTRGLAAAATELFQIDQRVATNRLDDADLALRLDEADRLLDDAQQSSANAEAALPDTTNPDASDPDAARAAQRDTQQALDALLNLLDAGQSTAGLNAELRQMAAQQQALTDAARALQPQTAGLDVSELPQPLRDALDELTDQQRDLAEQADDLTQRLADTADAMREQSDALQDQAAADAMQQAADAAQENDLSEQMQQAGAQLEQNQMADARAAQAQASETLQQMLQQFEQMEQDRQERLRALTRELRETIQRLAQRQSSELDALRALANPDLAPLEPALTDLRRNTLAARLQADASPELAGVAQLVAAAVAAQADAVLALRADDAPTADASEAAALAHLQEAVAALDEQQAQDAAQDALEARAELQQAFADLADRQAALRAAVADLVDDAGNVSRRDRPAVLEQADAESTLIDEAAALSEEVTETIVFSRLVDQIVTQGRRAADALATVDLSPATDRDLLRVELALRRAAEALAPTPADSPFAEESDAPQSANAAGGGAPPAPPPPVPPAAELRLLRGWQADLLADTRAAADATPAAPDAWLDALAAEQAAILELGQAMRDILNQMQSNAE